jgi:hypothetical protein
MGSWVWQKQPSEWKQLSRASTPNSGRLNPEKAIERGGPGVDTRELRDAHRGQLSLDVGVLFHDRQRVSERASPSWSGGRRRAPALRPLAHAAGQHLVNGAAHLTHMYGSAACCKRDDGTAVVPQ